MAAFDYKRTHKEEDLTYKGGLIPDCVARLVVDRFEFKKNKSTPGAIVAAATLKVVEPEGLKNRLIFLNMNVDHPNEKTRESGQKEMDRLLSALGINDDPSDTEELLQIEFTARVGETTPNPNAAPDPNFKPANRIERYYFPKEVGVPEIGIAPSPFRKTAASNAGGGARRPADNRDQRRGGGDDRGGNRDEQRGNDRDRGRGDDRGNDRGGDRSRDDRGRDDRGDNRGSNDRDNLDDSRGRGNGRNEDMRRDMGDDIPFDGSREERGNERDEQRGNDRPARGGNADSPFSRNR